jgi:hypothetical protein
MPERALFVLTRTDDLPAVAGSVAGLHSGGGSAIVLIGIRPSTEVAQALTGDLEKLGVSDRRWLGDAGARWPGRPPRRYTIADPTTETSWLESLTASDPGEIAADIAAAIELTKPDLVVAPPDGGDADQVRIQQAVRTAAEVLEVPWYKPRADGRGGLRFQRQRSGAARFVDYGLPTRIVTIIVAVLLGAFAGALLTAVHQSTLPVGDVPVPWGLIAAVLITAGLLVGLRILFGTRVVPAAAGAGLLAAAALFALQTAGGSVLVPANPLGYIWTFAPVVIGLAVVLWPRIGVFSHA